MRIVESIVVDASPESVWAAVADLDTHTAWRPAVREFRQVSDGPLGVGARIREVLEWRGREIVIEDEVTAFDPPRRFGVHGSWKAADFDLELRVEPVGEGTLVTMDWPLYPKSLVLKLAAPFMGGVMRKATREELELLKEHVERAGSTADAMRAP